MRTPYRFGQYAKAGLVFAATTATYFFARATGVLPSWFNGGKAETTEVTLAKSIISQMDEVNSHPMSSDFSVNDLSVADFEEVNLTPPQTDLAVEQPGTEKQYLVHTEPVHSMQRHLLQQPPPVFVVNPIPNQVINVQQPFQLSLDNVFSGNYALLKAHSMGTNGLPNWLELQYRQITANPSLGGSCMVLSNNLLFLGQGSQLKILEVSNPFEPILLTSSYSISPGNIEAMVVLGDVLFIAAQTVGLKVLNISIPSNPSLISAYSSGSDMVYGLAVSNNIVFLADLNNGIRIIDLSSKNSNLIATYNRTILVSSPMCLIASNNILFVGGGGYVQFLNISNLIEPQSITVYQTGGPYVDSLILYNNILFIAADFSGLQIVDITNITQPVLLSNYPSNLIGLGGASLQVAVLDNVAFVADGTAGLQILDISNLKNPNLISINPPLSGDYIAGVAVLENVVFVLGSRNLQILNLSQGDLVGIPPIDSTGKQFSITVEAYSTTSLLNLDSFIFTIDKIPYLLVNTLSDYSIFPNNSFSLSISSTRLFIELGNSFLGMSIVVKDNFSSGWLNLLPTPIFLSSHQGRFIELKIFEGILFGATLYGTGLQVIDISHPGNPVLLTTLSVNTYNNDGGHTMLIVDNVLYVADGFIGLHIFNVSTPQNPFLIGTYPGLGDNNYYQIAITGSRLLFASLLANSTIQVLDITNSGNPIFLYQYKYPSSPTISCIAEENNIVFAVVRDNLSHLHIFEMSSANLILVTTFDLNIIFTRASMVVKGNALFIEGHYGLTILDISNIKNPFIISTYFVTSFSTSLILGMAISGNLVFLACYEAGLQILDISNISNPVLLTHYKTDAAYSVTIFRNNIFIGDANADLLILDISQWQLTANPKTTDIGNYNLKLVVEDELGGSAATQPFTIRVEGPPQIHGLISAQYAKVNQAYNYFVPQGLITDPNFDPIIFNATLSSGRSLPDWLQFNAISATFAGTPQSADVGNYTIVLSATDNIAGTVNTTFNLLINDVPALNRPIPSQLANIGLLYQLILPLNTFNNPNSGGLNYSARQSNGLALPVWLSFNATQRSFQGLPQSSDGGRYGLSVVAIDQYNGQATASFILLVEYPPQVNQRIASRFAGADTVFIYPISANAFIDSSGTSLIYSASRADGALLPNWLSFNPEILIFSGKPLPTDIGILPVQLTATNSNGGKAQQVFNVTVTYFPQVVQSIPAQLVDVGSVYEFTVANTTFSDPDSPVLIYSAQWVNHPSLPAWLNFEDQLVQFTGVPNGSDTGRYRLAVSASDTYGAMASAEFTLVVDHFPRLNRPVASQLAGIGLPFSLTIPANTFIDSDEDALIYQIQPVGSSVLPNWLSFNPQTLVLAGVPQVTDLADLSLWLTATDSDGGKAQQNFNLSVIDFPIAMNSMVDQLADIGLSYQLTIASNTFQYTNVTALIYSVQQSDGSLLPDWLRFNATALKLQGVPHIVDAGLWVLAVIAANSRGAQAQVTFNLRVESFPRVNQRMVAPLAGINLPFTFNIPSNAFQDDDDELLTYQVSQTNSAPLPNWLSFNPYSLSFSGVPQVTDLGELWLRLQVTDSYGGWAQQNFNVTILYFPKLVQPIVAQLINVGEFYQWVLPNNTFQDPGGKVLSYSAQQKNGLALPNWLQFNAISRLLSGRPNTTDVGIVDLMMIARNSVGAQTTTQFTLQIEHFPQWQRVISDQWAGVGIAFSLTLPIDTVIDQDGEPLVYQATGSDGLSLPNWLSFNPQSLTFLGVPLEINVGALPILLTVKDPAGASVSGNFTVNVIHFPAVTVTTLPAPPTLWPGKTFTYSVPPTTFSDSDHLIQSYQATLADGRTLPAWLIFNVSTLVFSGIPSDSEVGAFNIKVTAQSTHQIQTTVRLNLMVATNLPPQLINPISDLTATVGDPFKFFVPADTFVDPEGESLHYTATQAGEADLPDWLSFDENDLYFSGTPQRKDTDTYSARAVPIVVTAKDTRSQGQTIFNINILGTSNWAFALKVSAPLISVLTALIAVYRERALCLNRCRKQRYQHPSQTVGAGSVFKHRLSTAPERIHKIEVKLFEPAQGRCRFFRSDQRTLPGNASLPSWMDYDTNTNTLHSKGVVPINTPPNLIVNVKDSGDVILEQFKLTVTGLFREEKGESLILEASGARSPVSMASSSRDRMLTFS